MLVCRCYRKKLRGRDMDPQLFPKSGLWYKLLISKRAP